MQRNHREDIARLTDGGKCEVVFHSHPFTDFCGAMNEGYDVCSVVRII